MQNTSARLPASEVARFGLRVFFRLLLAVVIGLIVMKAGQVFFSWPPALAIQYAEMATAILFFASFMIKSVPWPELDYGTDLPDDSIEGSSPN